MRSNLTECKRLLEIKDLRKSRMPENKLSLVGDIPISDGAERREITNLLPYVTVDLCMESPCHLKRRLQVFSQGLVLKSGDVRPEVRIRR